jgi:hypothetical protein
MSSTRCASELSRFIHSTRNPHDTVSIKGVSVITSWVQNVQAVQAVQNVLNDWNYLNELNSAQVEIYCLRSGGFAPSIVGCQRKFRLGET